MKFLMIRRRETSMTNMGKMLLRKRWVVAVILVTHSISLNNYLILQVLEDQKQLQGRLLAEKEACFGSKPSPTKSGKKAPRYSMSGAAAANRRYSVSGAMLQRQNFKPERTALHSHPIKKLSQFQDEGKRNNTPSGQLHKKQAKTINSKDFGSPKIRKPFALIRVPVTEAVHPTNTPEKQNMTPSKTLSAGNTPISTPPS